LPLLQGRASRNTAVLGKVAVSAFRTVAYAKLRGLRRAGKRRRIVFRERTVNPQERDELTKHREFEAINARLAQHDRKVQVTRLVVVLLNVVILALPAYLLLGHN
jgi:hypothetical protein